MLYILVLGSVTGQEILTMGIYLRKPTEAEYLDAFAPHIVIVGKTELAVCGKVNLSRSTTSLKQAGYAEGDF